jgi:N-acetylmuramoyl-L-alanine amidase
LKPFRAGAFCPPGGGGRRILTALFFLFIVAAALSAQAPALSLDETLAALGSLRTAEAPVEFRWDPFLRTGVFSAQTHQGIFGTASAPGETGFLLVDGRELFAVPLPYSDRGLLCFPSAFVGALKSAFTRFIEEDASRFRIAAIIIDPGHGGKDSGAVGNFVVNGKPLRVAEKEITLRASKLLRTLLAGAYPDKQILMTREGDTYPSLEDRVAIANSVSLKENEAIIYISVHANASFNKQARGYEVWYLSPDYRRTVLDKSKYADSAEVIPILNAMLEEEFTTESIIMAQSIVRGFEQTLGGLIPSRGIKAEEWFVVRNARMPSVLVELGFVTNEADALIMTSEDHLKKIAEALYKGVTEFVGVFERSGGFTAVQ